APEAPFADAGVDEDRLAAAAHDEGKHARLLDRVRVRHVREPRLSRYLRKAILRQEAPVRIARYGDLNVAYPQIWSHRTLLRLVALLYARKPDPWRKARGIPFATN